jgi:Mrp family chromosome partitioning ATPase
MEHNRVLPGAAGVAASRAYKILRTRVLRVMSANNWQTLAVTGTTAGEGKTLAAINLALALAENFNTPVILVDLDLQRPKVASYLGMTYSRGLSDYLSEAATLDEIVYDIGVPRCAVIPNRAAALASSELLRSPRMLELLRALKSESPRRIVMFDMPPLLASDDVLAIAPHVDSFLLVVSQGWTARRSLANVREALSELNVLGIVLNRSTEHNESRYY